MDLWFDGYLCTGSARCDLIVQSCLGVSIVPDLTKHLPQTLDVKNATDCNHLQTSLDFGIDMYGIRKLTPLYWVVAASDGILSGQ